MIMHRHACAVVAVAIACAPPGPIRGLNPTFRSGAPGPAAVLPIQDCADRKGVAKDPQSRQRFQAEIPGHIWTHLHQTGTPAVAAGASTSSWCNELMEPRDSWHGNALLRNEVARELSRHTGSRSVIVPLVTTRFACGQEKAAIRDSTGLKVGSIDVGQRCVEIGEITMRIVVLSDSGDTIWQRSFTCGGEIPGCNRSFELSPSAMADAFKDFPEQILPTPTAPQPPPPAAPTVPPPAPETPPAESAPPPAPPPSPAQAETPTAITYKAHQHVEVKCGDEWRKLKILDADDAANRYKVHCPGTHGAEWIGAERIRPVSQ
jgi:hypothetical protein